jgi:hypothetical protein
MVEMSKSTEPDVLEVLAINLDIVNLKTLLINCLK